MGDDQVLATFFGDDEFPIEWEDGQRELFWVHDDLHIPNPISPMYADIGGWWLKCDYMFGGSGRRSPRTGSPRSSTATSTPRRSPRRPGCPPRPRSTAAGTHRACRWTRRIPPSSVRTWAGRCPTTRRTSSC